MTNFKNFFIRNKKLLSVFFSVAFSVLVVAVLVHGATTIGANITTGGNLNASGTMLVTGLTTPYGGVATTTWDAGTIGATTAVVTGDFTAIGSVTPGTGAFTTLTGSGILTINSTATSTLSGTINLTKSDATTTLHISDHDAAVAGRGGCIALGSTSSTPTGVSHLYLMVIPDGTGTGLMLATSTDPTDCY